MIYKKNIKENCNTKIEYDMSLGQTMEQFWLVLV